MSAAEAEAYKTTMNTLLKSLEKIRKYASDCLTSSAVNLDDVNVRMKRAEDLLSQYLEVETKLFIHNSDEVSKFFEAEDIYYAAIGDFNTVISKKRQSMRSESLEHETLGNAALPNIGLVSERDSRDIKLPKLEIPKFSGNYTDWQAFYEMFTQQIDECKRLSDIQKFHYLKGYLTDEAANLIKHMNVTSANYSEALDKLRKRYDRKRYAVNSFVRRFIEQPAIQQATSNNMRKIHDVCDEVIRGLKSVGTDAESRDPWLIYLIINKLDNETRCEWAEQSAKDEFPSFKQFLEFLSNRIDALESYGASAKSTNIRPDRNLKTFATVTSSCELCNAENHKLYECTKFKELSVTERRSFIADKKRCFNCLNVGHNVYNCRGRARCQKCYRKHNSLLHEDVQQIEGEIKEMTDPAKENEVSSMHCTKADSVCILPTAMVKVQNSKGSFHSCKALLDSASEVSFISERAFKALNLPKEARAISIKGLGSTHMGKTKGIAKINLMNDDASYKTIFSAYVVPHIAIMQPVTLTDNNVLQDFKSLKLADRDCLNGGDIDLLLGSDIFFDTMSDGKVQGSQMSAFNTKFGWILVGKLVDDFNVISSVSLNVMTEVDSTLKRFWEVENIPRITEYSNDDICEQLFSKTTKISSDNKFTVRLPFKIQPEELGSTYNIAYKRLLSMERRFQRDKIFKSLYHDFLSEYEALGHMKLLGQPNPNSYYLPHHGVLKQSTTTRLRVVFDGSTKSTTNLSLNDTLEIGPTIQSSLVEIMLRFRQHKYVLSGDIEKMYRMIWVHDDDAKYQQILWRTNPDSTPQAYQLRTVTYGTTSASFLSTRCIKEIANRIESKYPHVANILSKNVYVDDLMCGYETIEGLIKLKNLLTSSLNEFGFNLRKLRSNNLSAVAGSNIANETSSEKELSNEGESSKILGLSWDSYQDEFTFKCDLPKSVCLTKRGLLSDASKIFDPLGWLSPLTVKIKILFQRLWLEPITWDDLLPSQTKQDWLKLRNSLSHINKIRIPRWLNTTDTIELCGFCDASELAYSAVIYAISGKGANRRSTIVISKTKVAPIEQITLARLELQAAHILTQLMSFVEQTLTLKIDNITMWTDSKLVLDWLSSFPKRWKTFVANRTSYILSKYKRVYWNHINSEENPADCATRGLSIDELMAHKLWWAGPVWLCDETVKYPNYTTDNINNVEVHEERSQINAYVVVQDIFLEQLLSRYSSFYRMCYNLVIANKCIAHLKNKYIIKLNNICRTRTQINNMLRPSPDEITDASHRLCLYEQKRGFAEEYKLLSDGKPVSNKSRLKTLNPFIHSDKLIRLGGRISNSTCQFNKKHPIILPNDSIICKPIIKDYHEFHNHAGIGLCISLLRQKYWILRCKTIVRLVIHKCVKCFRAHPQVQTQLMGDLPECRVQYSHAFANTGVDYCGPFDARVTNRRNQPTTKVYLCLFICLATKAVHVEVVTTLSSEGFIAALHRFIARRGLCKNIYSDNGANFVGANNHLMELYKFLRNHTETIYSYLLKFEIKWHFIPPGAPNMGGIWEASIKLIKSNLKKVTSGHILSFEEFMTLVTRIEASINSRPLYVESDDDLETITPAHFLIGRALTDIPDDNCVEFSGHSRWKMVKQMYNEFWQRWHRDYLSTLQRRTKWHKQSQNLKIDDIVLLVDGNTPSCNWPLARVLKTHPGRDGLVRVVTLKIPRLGTILQRPISKVCKLPIYEDDLHLNEIDSGGAGCCDEAQSEHETTLSVQYLPAEK